MAGEFDCTITEKDYVQVLCKANQKFAEVESLEELVPMLLEMVRNMLCAEASSFLIYNPESDSLKFANIRDETVSDVSRVTMDDGIEIPLGKGIAGLVAGDRTPLIVNDAQSNPQVLKKIDELTGFTTRAILAVPVLYRDELLGVIEVVNAKRQHGFDASDKDLLASFANLAAVAIVRARLLSERLQQQALSIEMETAQKIQALFSPTMPIPQNGSHAWAFSKSAASVGGDLCDIIEMPDKSWLIYVADVSDKGLPAALIMAALWYRIRSEAHTFKGLRAMLESLNTSLHKLLAEEGYFVTIFCGQYWPQTGKFEFVNGGHLPAIRARVNEYEIVRGEKGLPLGIIENSQYRSTTITLAENASILLMTDGISEAMNSSSEMFGEQRILQELKKADRPPWGRDLLSAVSKWQSNTNQNDDLTIIEIWRAVIQ